MKKNVITFLSAFICISIILTGCAKKEEPLKEAVKEEPKAPKVFLRVEEQKTEPASTKETSDVPVPSEAPITEERVLFSFEKDVSGWEVPDWALDKDDHVAETLDISTDFASEGEKSLKVDCNFPGGIWSAAVIEHEQYMDFSPYREITVDIYIPEDTPLGLRAKMILTVGEKWKFTEMTRAIPLVPGEWTTIKASIDLGSYDWKRTVVTEEFRQDIRKMVVRVESNRRPVYSGPVYVDNIKLGK